MSPRDAIWTIVVLIALTICVLVLHAHGVF